MMPAARIQIAPMPNRRILVVSFFFRPMLIMRKGDNLRKEGVLVSYAFYLGERGEDGGDG